MKKIALLAWLLSLSCHSFSQQIDDERLPDIGVAGLSALTIDKELALGDAVMRQIRGQGGDLQDPVLQDYLQDIGNRLVVLSDDVRFPFEFFLVSHPAINAFAFFGGHIGVHTGLISAADNESELASVLAHEIAHVTQRHLARRMQAQQENSNIQMAGLLTGLLLALGNPQAGMAAMMGNAGISRQKQINYTRKNEKEADRIGMRIIQRSQYDPSAASAFFAKLARKERYNSEVLPYLRTHPMALDRVADSRSRYTQSMSLSKVDNRLFELAKARVNVRYHKGKDWLRYYQNQLKQSPKNNGYRYGLALAYFENNEFDKAKSIISQLRFRDAKNLFYIDLSADIAIAQRNFDSATRMLDALLELRPNNRVLVLNKANVMIKAGQYEDAIELLRNYMIGTQNDLLCRQLLAEGYERLGKSMDSLQEKAEVYALMGVYPRAIDTLHNAYNAAISKNNHLEMQRINARIAQFKRKQELIENL